MTRRLRQPQLTSQPVCPLAVQGSSPQKLSSSADWYAEHWGSQAVVF
jgi:hypothetical protein